MMRAVTAEQGPPLPVVSPDLQDGVFERPCGERVQDGVEGTVNGENEYDHPGADGTCRERGRNKITKLAYSQCLRIINMSYLCLGLGETLRQNPHVKAICVINENPSLPCRAPN